MMPFPSRATRATRPQVASPSCSVTKQAPPGHHRARQSPPPHDDRPRTGTTPCPPAGSRRRPAVASRVGRADHPWLPRPAAPPATLPTSGPDGPPLRYGHLADIATRPYTAPTGPDDGVAAPPPRTTAPPPPTPCSGSAAIHRPGPQDMAGGSWPSALECGRRRTPGARCVVRAWAVASPSVKAQVSGAPASSMQPRFRQRNVAEAGVPPALATRVPVAPIGARRPRQGPYTALMVTPSLPPSHPDMPVTQFDG